jgi:NADP-dependent 3-hydroxy acid dehydrogenase YdfG
VERTVLVTGAGSGIGLATVIELGRLGFRPVGVVPDGERADTVAEAAAEAGVGVATEVLDVADLGAGAAAVNRIRPWALVDTAGYVNAGAVALARAALACMRADGGGGRIVTVLPVSAGATAPLVGWRQATGKAMSAIHDALRAEARGAEVEVVLVEAGASGDPGGVAELVGIILTSGRPRARYTIGAGGVALRLGEALVPPPVKDRLLRAALGR